jgi:hypothetical protein
MSMSAFPALPAFALTPSEALDDAFPMSLPSLAPTPSQAMDTYETVRKSRLACVKEAVSTTLDTITILNRDASEENQIKVKLVLVDTGLKELTGPISSLKRQLASLYADNGTNLINIVTHALTSWDATPVEHRHKLVGMVFTDGFHNAEGDMNSESTKDAIRRLAETHSICAYMGIGSSASVDHATLTRLSEGQPGCYTNALCATDVVNTIQARCFEMLTARDTKDVIIRLVCKSDTVIPDSIVNGTLSQEEFEALAELPPSKLATFDHIGDTCLITPTISSDVSHAAKGQELTLYIDTSGSMGSAVEGGLQPLQSLDEKQADAAPVKPWVELSLPVSSWTSASHLFFKAHLGRVSIEYTDVQGERRHECITANRSSDMAGVTQLVDMMNWLNTRVMIREVRTYYKEHMRILHDALDYPQWLRNHIKAVWAKVKERYRRVGPSTAAKTMQKGDAFFEAPPVTLMELARTATSSASTPTADGTLGADVDAAPQDDWDKCKICFDKQAEMVFTGCGHAVVCMGCFKEHLNKDGKAECCVCRHVVEDYAMMDYSTGLHCKTCDQPGAYIGNCGHMHFCGTCVPKTRRVSCTMCASPTDVALVRVYL